MASLGQTSGRANTPFGTEYKELNMLPLFTEKGLLQAVARESCLPQARRGIWGIVKSFHAHNQIKPQTHGMLRRSTRVLAINDMVAANPPASRCAGRPWKDFVSCLRREMKALVGRGA